jgi:hypothetical protein
MTTNQIQIGTKIERIASDYTGGRKGTVIEIKDGRARIVWDAGHPRTWIKFAALLVLAQPSQTVRGEWVATPGSKRHSAIRVCTNEARGETWHEYQKL